jgi:hypothetical protein
MSSPSINGQEKIYKVNTMEHKFFVFNSQYTLVSNSTKIPSVFFKVFKDIGISHTSSFHEASIIFLDSFDNFDKLANVPFNPSVCIIYGLRSINMLVSKSILAMTLRMHSSKAAMNIIPTTWVPIIAVEQSRLFKTALLKNHGNGGGRLRFPIICKKNKQQQKGITLVNTEEELKKVPMTEYAVCQQLLLNPFTIFGRKINIRIYLLIFVNQSEQRVEGHMYENGFIYYTPEKFSSTKITIDRHITTGYIDRSVYDTHPLTLLDLYDHLMNGTSDGHANAATNFVENPSHLLRTNIRALMTELMNAYIPLFNQNELETPRNPNRFIIVGCDIAPDRHLGVRLMEVNKGPDLTAKDERDGRLKTDLVMDALRICGILKNSKSTDNYTRII